MSGFGLDEMVLFILYVPKYESWGSRFIRV